MDERIKTLAHNLVHYSCRVGKGDKVMIEYIGADTQDLARQIVKEVYRVGGQPYPVAIDPRMRREFLLGCTEEQLTRMAENDAAMMSQMDCYMGIRGGDNIMENADVPAEQMSLFQRCYNRPVHSEIRVPKTRWVVMRYPSPSMAQSAGTSLEAFEDFYFNVCNLDYSKMNEAMKPLIALMDRTDRVHIKGPGTNLTFSIKGIPAVPCAGNMNIPDGEVFTAPVRDSVEGVLTYNTPSVYQGTTFEKVCLKFEKGKIVEATASDTEKINHILDMDGGARYIGEFAIGVNPYVIHPMKDTLFDEKIMGSFHFTPGSCYDEAPNGNHSAVHWDLVCIQTPEYGGGEIWFDDVLIRKDGRFVIEELFPLNPENLR